MAGQTNTNSVRVYVCMNKTKKDHHLTSEDKTLAGGIQTLLAHHDKQTNSQSPR